MSDHNRRRSLPRRPSTATLNGRHVRAGSARIVALVRQHMQAAGLVIYDLASELRTNEVTVLAYLSLRANFPASRADAWADALRLPHGSPEREEFLDCAALSALDVRGLAVVDRLRG
jgi:hypothetical protein